MVSFIIGTGCAFNPWFMCVWVYKVTLSYSHMAVMPSLIFLLKLAWQHVTFKWKNRNQILTELEKEETAHFCVTLYGLIVNSCSLTGRMFIWHGEISKTQLSHVSRSGLLRRCFGRFPVLCKQWDPPLPSYSKLPIFLIYVVELQVLDAFFSVELFLHGQPYCFP